MTTNQTQTLTVAEVALREMAAGEYGERYCEVALAELERFEPIVSDGIDDEDLYDTDIRELEYAAGEAGDTITVALCLLALDSEHPRSGDARRQIAEMVAEANAMCD